MYLVLVYITAYDKRKKALQCVTCCTVRILVLLSIWQLKLSGTELNLVSRAVEDDLYGRQYYFGSGEDSNALTELRLRY